jgi:3-oxoacyl-[acyl-carrier-protein] synthase II
MIPRVVVTGIGLVTPLGLTRDSSWERCVAGQSGIGRIEKMNVDEYPVKIAGEVRGFDGSKAMNGKDSQRYDLVFQFSQAAAIEALQDAKLQITPENAERVGIVIGSGIGGMTKIYDTSVLIATEGPRRVSPFFVPAGIINTASGYAAIHFGAKGPNYGVVSACATGNHAIADGFHIVRRGEADVMIVGGSEASVSPLALAGFCAARALSKRNDEPERASRPFDRDRDGFVLGEGAGVLVIENYEHAVKRNCRIYAEILSCGMSADAFHITAPAENGEGAARAMKLALAWAGVKAEEVDHINSHGTSTQIGDIAETDAIKSVFGPHAKSLAINATKSMTGHLLGAASAIEAAFAILSLYHGIIPPTINLENPDPRCDLDYVPLKARRREARIALSNGFGFGGTNTSLCLKRIDR